MNDTTIIIAYEDRLRLSELAGELTKAQWAVDHMWIANMLGIAMAFFVGLLLLTFIAVYLYDFCRTDCAGLLIFGAFVLSCVVIPIITAFVLHEFDMMNVVQIQAQIDEIYRMYGMDPGGAA